MAQLERSSHADGKHVLRRTTYILIAAALALVAALPIEGAWARPVPAAHTPSLKVAGNGHPRDRVGSLPARGKGPLLRWDSYALPGGEAVSAASASYGSAQVGQVLGIVGSLPHGAEMNSLSIYVATPQEIGATCGG